MDLIRKISHHKIEKCLTIQGSLDENSRDPLCIICESSADADFLNEPYDHAEKEVMREKIDDEFLGFDFS